MSTALAEPEVRTHLFKVLFRKSEIQESEYRNPVLDILDAKNEPIDPNEYVSTGTAPPIGTKVIKTKSNDSPGAKLTPSNCELRS